MNTTWTKEKMTDKVIGDIASRWRQLSYIRQLYLDDVVVKEFQHFRAQFAADEGLAAIVEPGVMKSSQPKQSHHFGHDFKARFHKSLCLHSMAIASRNVAKVAVVDGPPEHLIEISEQIRTDVYDLWSKHSVVIAGEKRLLGLDTRLDYLEVFDFVYLFLLKKVVPFDRLEDWIGQDSEHWPYSPNIADDDHELFFQLLDHCRCILHPHDLVDLIKHRAWTADAHYHQDKSEYMGVRSMFDIDTHGRRDFRSVFQRSSMLHALRPHGIVYSYTGSEGPYSWDLIRLDIGSPSQSDSRSIISESLAEHKMI